MDGAQLAQRDPVGIERIEVVRLEALLAAPELPVDAAAAVTPCQDPPGWRIERRDADQLIGEAVVTAPVQGIGSLSWISIEASARGHGLARPLLGRALEVLWEHGAREVILYVDDDEPDGERDRTAANRLYDTSGFTEIDRLHSYTRAAG